MMMHDSHTHTILNGIVGMVGSIFAVLTTFQEQVEWWIRVTGGLLGILVALASLISLICKFVKSHR